MAAGAGGSRAGLGCGQNRPSSSSCSSGIQCRRGPACASFQQRNCTGRLRSLRRTGRRESPAAASQVEGTSCAHRSLGPHLLFGAWPLAGIVSISSSPKSSAFCAILACRWSSYRLSCTGRSGDASREKEGECEEGSRAVFFFFDRLHAVALPLRTAGAIVGDRLLEWKFKEATVLIRRSIFFATRAGKKMYYIELK